MRATAGAPRIEVLVAGTSGALGITCSPSRTTPRPQQHRHRQEEPRTPAHEPPSPADITSGRLPPAGTPRRPAGDAQINQFGTGGNNHQTLIIATQNGGAREPGARLITESDMRSRWLSRCRIGAASRW